jgi:hypothetical protein
VLLEKAQQYGSGLVSGNSLSWDGLMSDGRHHPQARWHNPEKSSEEAGDLEMKTVKAITLSALLAVSILAIARAQSGFYDLMIEIEPPHLPQTMKCLCMFLVGFPILATKLLSPRSRDKKILTRSPFQLQLL